VPLHTGEIALPVRRDHSFRWVLAVCVVIVIMLTGQNTFYTYIAPWLVQAAHFPASSIAFLLFLFGGAGAVGLLLAGFAADRFPKRGFAVAALAMMVSVLVLALASANGIIVVVAFVVWGVAFGGVPAMLQTRMLHTASLRVRDLAAALQTTAFNVGIGGGALLGAVLLDGIGLGTLPLIAVGLFVISLVLSVTTDAARSASARRA
jgi:predicted MFS family arabinose efflux permease